MKTVKIVYRYGSPGEPTRPRPHDAEAARLRLSDRNHAFATLLDSLSEGAGLTRRVIDVDPRDLGLLQGEHSARRRSTLLRSCSGVLTRGCRSN
jgi:carbonic anhydrase